MIVITAKELKEKADRSGVVETLAVFGGNIRVGIPLCREFLAVPIENLSLSVRSGNALKRAGIDDVRTLSGKVMSGKGLSDIRNLGRISVSEIKTVLLAGAYEMLDDPRRMEFWQKTLELNRAG